MKKRFLLLVVALFALICFAACGGSKAKGDGEITLVVVDEAGKELFNDELAYFTGDTLVDVFTKDEKVKMTGETSEYGFFIESVCGKKATDAGETYFWNLKVNGEVSLVGISSVVIENGMKIELILTDWTKTE